MIHYHGTPITPMEKLLRLGGRNFCVSFAAPYQVSVLHDIGQSVMLDNGAFSFWKSQKPTNWNEYYKWTEKWLLYRTTWAVIPDVIDGTEAENDKLLSMWPHGNEQAAPVWHLHESIERLSILCSQYSRVCIGSSGQYSVVGNMRWHRRMRDVFNEIVDLSGKPPAWLHMLRGMSLSGSHYPFSSVDSTDIARNHNRWGDIEQRANKWDSVQCPSLWRRQAFEIALC